jgi:hypothetical protein
VIPRQWNLLWTGRAEPLTIALFISLALGCLNFSTHPCRTSPLHNHLFRLSSIQILWPGVPRLLCLKRSLFSSPLSRSVWNSRSSWEIWHLSIALQDMGSKKNFFFV